MEESDKYKEYHRQMYIWFGVLLVCTILFLAFAGDKNAVEAAQLSDNSPAETCSNLDYALTRAN